MLMEGKGITTFMLGVKSCNRDVRRFVCSETADVRSRPV